jgi:hypothetical protein
MTRNSSTNNSVVPVMPQTVTQASDNFWKGGGQQSIAGKL